MNPQFEKFCKRFGQNAADELLTRICDAHWNGSGDGVKFTDIHQHNACNHTLSGSIEHAGETFYFIIDNGDRNGTQVNQFGTVDDVGIYSPPEPTRYMFVPANDNLEAENPGMYAVYLKWKEESWFLNKLAAYLYDRIVQPGHAIEKHYSDWAAKKGMKIAPIGDLDGKKTNQA